MHHPVDAVMLSQRAASFTRRSLKADAKRTALRLAVSMVGTSEAMNLGERLGIDPKVLAGIMNTSTGRCWSSDTYNPCPGVMEGVPSSRDYSGGFANASRAGGMYTYPWCRGIQIAV